MPTRVRDPGLTDRPQRRDDEGVAHWTPFTEVEKNIVDRELFYSNNYYYDGRSTSTTTLHTRLTNLVMDRESVTVDSHPTIVVRGPYRSVLRVHNVKLCRLFPDRIRSVYPLSFILEGGEWTQNLKRGLGPIHGLSFCVPRADTPTTETRGH